MKISSAFFERLALIGQYFRWKDDHPQQNAVLVLYGVNILTFNYFVLSQ